MLSASRQNLTADSLSKNSLSKTDTSRTYRHRIASQSEVDKMQCQHHDSNTPWRLFLHHISLTPRQHPIMTRKKWTDHTFRSITLADCFGRCLGGVGRTRCQGPCLSESTSGGSASLWPTNSWEVNNLGLV
jgi:hypothetical protein